VRPLVICLGVLIVFVVQYAYVLLPLDLGVGLREGYLRLGSLAWGITMTAAWVVLVAIVGFVFGLAIRRGPAGARRALLIALAASLALIFSYPLVVLFMYTALDFALETGQVGISTAVGRVYWILLLISAIAVVLAPIGLRRLSSRTRRIPNSTTGTT